LHYYHQPDLKYNFVLATTAEEEISGSNGVEILLPRLPKIDCGIIGEPTLMNMAIAEKGLLVLDCVAHGKPGHAAREEGDNAIYKAVKDIEWFISYRYPKVSGLLGPMKMSVTIINAGTQHNVVPHECRYTVDVRVNELYTFEEVLEIIRSNVQSDVLPRSCRLRSTSITTDHPLILAGLETGRPYYGSPTTSDKALMDFQTLKMGPGDSARSHIADEFIYIEEIRAGIDLYIQLLDKMVK
jgi:acetylornithine deacetylase